MADEDNLQKWEDCSLQDFHNRFEWSITEFRSTENITNNRLSHDEPCGSRLFFCDAWNASGGAQAMVQLLACFPRSCFERFGY
ncbi:MAG: hypothetical protein ACLS8R_09770 [Anaeromassilibacillus sp.]